MNSGSSKAKDEDRTYVSPVAQGEVIDAAERAKTQPVNGLTYNYGNYKDPAETTTPTPETDVKLG